MFHPFGILGLLKYKLLSHMAKNIEMQGAADFDWEALQLDGYTKIERSELSDVYEKTLTSINEKEVIQGTVALLNKKEVIVNIGYKSEGVIAANEFRYNPDLKVGDVVPIFIERINGINFKITINKPLNFSKETSIKDITIELLKKII